MELKTALPKLKRRKLLVTFASKIDNCGIDSILAATIIAERVKLNIMSDQPLVVNKKLKTYLIKKYRKAEIKGHANNNKSRMINTKCPICNWTKPGANARALQCHLKSHKKSE